MVALSILRLEWADRPAGYLQTPRRFLEFVVDGRPLTERLGGNAVGNVTPLGWLGLEADTLAVRRLLREAPTELGDERPDFYICAECGDIGCGAITATVERRGGQYVWQDFAYRWLDSATPSGHRGPGTHNLERDAYTTVGPFSFEAAAYATALRTVLRQGAPGY
jgi:hypothetical protein